MIVVDSSVWIDFFAARETDQTRKLREIALARSIIVGDIVLLEVLRGARDDAQTRRYERALRRSRFQYFLDPELAVVGAGHYRRLREKGLTIRRPPDLVIGTYCLRNRYRLLHNDRDFAVMAEHLGLMEY